ncbi:TPA: hypothetical protein ACH3X3_006866 [Trebouxia sp. C0006]
MPNHTPTTFSRHTYKLQLPAFMLNTASTPITPFDFYGVKRFARGQHKWTDAVPNAGIINGLSISVGCPAFKRDFADERTGSLWPIGRLTPCKLAAVPH